MTWSISFKDWLRSDPIFSILNQQSPDDLTLCDWSSGGCLLLATALQQCLAEVELIAVGTPYCPINHVVAKIGKHFIDGDGVFDQASLLAHQTNEYNTLCYLAPYDNQTSEMLGIVCPEAKLKQLTKELTHFLALNPLPLSDASKGAL